MKTLKDRVAVVTGGASGVGEGIVRALAYEGARVALADRDEARAAQSASALRKSGYGVQPFAVDVVDRNTVNEMVAGVLDEFGRVDILAANAGIYPTRRLSALTDDDWDRVMDVNVKGALHVLQACLPAMRAQRYGRVVMTSSITGPVVAHRDVAHYAASKAAMLGLMRSAALELSADGITVNAVLPGNVRTPGFDALGWAVRFLASEEAAYITGQTLIVDGGQVLPEGSAS
jgi:3-oxoacyl-[acyl-carrier protein] reductase